MSINVWSATNRKERGVPHPEQNVRTAREEEWSSWAPPGAYRPGLDRAGLDRAAAHRPSTASPASPTKASGLLRFRVAAAPSAVREQADQPSRDHLRRVARPRRRSALPTQLRPSLAHRRPPSSLRPRPVTTLWRSSADCHQRRFLRRMRRDRRMRTDPVPGMDRGATTGVARSPAPSCQPNATPGSMKVQLHRSVIRLRGTRPPLHHRARCEPSRACLARQPRCRCLSFR